MITIKSLLNGYPSDWWIRTVYTGSMVNLPEDNRYILYTMYDGRTNASYCFNSTGVTAVCVI